MVAVRRTRTDRNEITAPLLFRNLLDASHSDTFGKVGKSLAGAGRIRPNHPAQSRTGLSCERTANPLVAPKKASLRIRSRSRRSSCEPKRWLGRVGGMTCIYH